MPEERDERPFNLLRWFSIASFLVIALISAASAYFLSQFLTTNLLRREANLSMQLIERFVEAENAAAYFSEREELSQASPVVEPFFAELSRLPDVVRANVYGRDRRLIWSSKSELTGQRFEGNPDLDRAFAGHVEVKAEHREEMEKAEHVLFEGMDPRATLIEAYIPIWDKDRRNVVGVVEIYKFPRVLQETIDRGNRLVWASAGIGGVFLYVTLFWIVRRAGAVIRAQQQRLVESETLAAMGEMASAVAHSIRNPLAAMRSSAEIAATADLALAREAAGDIIGEADRLDRWVRELLIYARSEGPTSEPTDLNAVVRTSLAGWQQALERQRITPRLALAEKLPSAGANPAPIGQVLNSLIANALEAMPKDGELKLETSHDGQAKSVEIRVSDTGAGLTAEAARKAFRPFFTTKQGGLGVGLALSRRIVARYGGTLDLASATGRGTTAILRLPVASA
ncbi:MAG: ATP-binding protein [Alphaproteobacteria bacterium]